MSQLCGLRLGQNASLTLINKTPLGRPQATKTVPLVSCKEQRGLEEVMEEPFENSSVCFRDWAAKLGNRGGTMGQA